MIDLFEVYGLAPELTEHLYAIPLFSIYGINGKPLITKTIRDTKARLLLEVYNEPKGEEGFRATYAESVGLTLDELNALEANVYELMFKGVDPTLPMPIMMHEFSPMDFKIEGSGKGGTITTAHPVCYSNECDSVTFSVNNLIKHCGYSKQDAQNFYRNIKNNPFYGKRKWRIPKRGKIPFVHNVFTCNVGEGILCMWSLTQDSDTKKRVHSSERELTELDLHLVQQFAVPDIGLTNWKDVCKRWVEREKGFDWDYLSIQEQQRHLLNTIRHNSIAYNESWRNVEPSKMKEFHDIAFDDITRQVMRLYPWLANECKRQLDSRGL
ncbi:TPA: hypothetical protein I7730_00825 [Vibrio vulnificus]|uniref:Uncharacterized protein n=1 Tax=Vibrio vulnificus TaxID=672 RepID=A0A8H9K5R8_VIBVL|nr:hypothetical protein [Vibrio vulnificus]